MVFMPKLTVKWPRFPHLGLPAKQEPPLPPSGLIMSSDMFHHLTYIPMRHVTYTYSQL